MSDEVELSLDDRYLRFALVLVTALITLGLAILYGRSLEVAAEIEMLEAIPVLDEDPDPLA